MGTDVRACAPPSRPSPTAGPAQAAPRTSVLRERSENRKRPNFIGLQPGSISETAAFTSAKTPFSLRVRDTYAFVTSVRAEGGSVVSRIDKLGEKLRRIFVRDPNGLLIELVQSQ